MNRENKSFLIGVFIVKFGENVFDISKGFFKFFNILLFFSYLIKYIIVIL